MRTVQQKYTYVLALMLALVVGWAVARLPRGVTQVPAPMPAAPPSRPLEGDALQAAWVAAMDGLVVPMVAGERRSGDAAKVEPLAAPPAEAPPFVERVPSSGVQRSPFAVATEFRNAEAYAVESGLVTVQHADRGFWAGALRDADGAVVRWLDEEADRTLARPAVRVGPSPPAEPYYQPPGNDWTREELRRTWSGPLRVTGDDGLKSVPLPRDVRIVCTSEHYAARAVPLEQGWVAALQCLTTPGPTSEQWLGHEWYQDLGLLLVASDGEGNARTTILSARTAPNLGLPAGQVASIGYSYPMVALDGQSVYAVWSGEFGRQVDAAYTPPDSNGHRRPALRLQAFVRWTPPA
ncbi:MAG TPA: hypothetical protein DCZ72_04435, partial [Armatimonadetes bacterium]|nr:hypothetical protein [Armatimonadota bacterium]